MKALVTGGAGFIGSHLAQALCRQGAEVVVLDDLTCGSLSNLDWRQPGDRLEFVQGDIADGSLLRKILPGCRWVFHHAAIASVPRSVDEPGKCHAVNLDAALTLLLAARDTGVERFVFASSSSIYGDSLVSPKHENLPPNPLSPYALQKYAAETYGRLFNQLYGLPTVGLRYFNVFGPRQSSDSPYSGVIAKFCTQFLKGDAPVIFGDGLQSRDFVYVDNVVSANLLVATAAGERVAGRIFNVAGGGSVTLLDLVSELGRLTGRILEPRFEPARIGDVRASEADLSALVAATGYRVTVPWREGLARTLDFYRR